eukprot:scaffold65171_cov59-Phaeocystis_antarctica.AAC.2
MAPVDAWKRNDDCFSRQHKQRRATADNTTLSFHNTTLRSAAAGEARAAVVNAAASSAARTAARSARRSAHCFLMARFGVSTVLASGSPVIGLVALFSSHARMAVRS